MGPWVLGYCLGVCSKSWPESCRGKSTRFSAAMASREAMAAILGLRFRGHPSERGFTSRERRELRFAFDRDSVRNRRWRRPRCQQACRRPPVQELDPRRQSQHSFNIVIENGEATVFQVEGLYLASGQKGHLDVHVHDPLVDRLYPVVGGESLVISSIFEHAWAGPDNRERTWRPSPGERRAVC